MTDSTALAPLQAGAVVAGETRETSAAGAQARQFALIQAAHSRAMMAPRQWAQVQARLLDACSRPGVALGACYTLYRQAYDREAGAKRLVVIRGASVRLAEEATRALGNTMRLEEITYEDDRVVQGNSILIDLEANNTVVQPWRVSKTIERRKLFAGEVALEERAGSGGKVYVVAAPDSEVRVKLRAATARARRDLVYEILPSDIKEAALAQVRATLLAEIERDRAPVIERIREALHGSGATTGQLRAVLRGKDFADAEPEHLLELLEVANAVDDGGATWAMACEAIVGETPATLGGASDERAKALERLQRIGAERPPLLEQALQANEIPADARLESLPLEGLRALVATTDRLLEAQAEKGQATLVQARRRQP